MSFITPSFPSHGFGLLELNAVTLKTSPFAIAFRPEHVSSKQYALYLQSDRFGAGRIQFDHPAGAMD